MLKTICRAAAVAAAIGAATSPLTAQSAEELLNTALDKYGERMEGIQNYTLVQDVMGTPTKVYFERETSDGHPVFRTHVVSAAGQTIRNPDASSGAMNDPYRVFPKLAKRAKLRGDATVDGKRVKVLQIDDLSGLDWGSTAGGQTGGFEPTQMTLYLDTDRYVVRRMEMKGDVQAGGQSKPVETVATFSDYREVEGLLQPFRTTIMTEGMLEASNMSPEERAKAQRSLEQMEEQMKTMPAAQKKMMEGMMGGQMKKLREMLATGSMEMTLEVTSVEVNEGPPSE